MADKVAERTAPKEPAKKEPAKDRVSPVDFFRQVRAETLKVTWPSRKETLITTTMVFVMVVAASIFFLGVDYILSHLVQLLVSFRS